MQVRIEKWGEGLAVRIPDMFVGQCHLERDSMLDMTIENGKIILSSNQFSKVTLDHFLEGITANNLHGETNTGPWIGREQH